jgi:hypothetical protein
MFKEDPHCRLCGVEMWLPPAGKNPTKDLELIQTMATIDHIYSKLNPRRYTVPNGDKRIQLVCWLCNNYKGQLEDLMLPLEERQERSRRYKNKIA